MHAPIKLFYDFRSWLSGSAVPKDDFVALERDFVRKVAFPSFEWADKSEPSPMNLPNKPLEECRVALVATGGVYVKGQKPYKMGLSGDSSYRIIPADIDFASLRVRHAGYNTRRIRGDLNCVFPLERLTAGKKTTCAKGNFERKQSDRACSIGFQPVGVAQEACEVAQASSLRSRPGFQPAQLLQAGSLCYAGKIHGCE